MAWRPGQRAATTASASAFILAAGQAGRAMRREPLGERGPQKRRRRGRGGGRGTQERPAGGGASCRAALLTPRTRPRHPFSRPAQQAHSTGSASAPAVGVDGPQLGAFCVHARSSVEHVICGQMHQHRAAALCRREGGRAQRVLADPRWRCAVGHKRASARRQRSSVTPRASPQPARLPPPAPSHLPCCSACRCSASSSCVGTLMARAAASPSPSHAAGAA